MYSNIELGDAQEMQSAAATYAAIRIYKSSHDHTGFGLELADDGTVVAFYGEASEAVFPGQRLRSVDGCVDQVSFLEPLFPGFASETVPILRPGPDRQPFVTKVQTLAVLHAKSVGQAAVVALATAPTEELGSAEAAALLPAARPLPRLLVQQKWDSTLGAVYAAHFEAVS